MTDAADGVAYRYRLSWYHVFIDPHKVIDIADETVGDLRYMNKSGNIIIKFDESTIGFDTSYPTIYRHSDFVIIHRSHTH